MIKENKQTIKQIDKYLNSLINQKSEFHIAELFHPKKLMINFEVIDILNTYENVKEIIKNSDNFISIEEANNMAVDLLADNNL